MARRKSAAVDVWVAGLLAAAVALVRVFGGSDEPEPVVRMPLPVVQPVPQPANDKAGITLASGQFVAESGLVAGIPQDRRDGTLHVRYNGLDLTPLAPALDGRLHFVNAYLVGYVPDAGVAPWVPLYTLASRKVYQTDRDQYGYDERWQTSYEAMHNERGDCEDHALALADWLIGLGMDARVVLGTVRGEGHAWVVVREGERVFLLESTDKRRVRRWAYPLAELHPEYRPGDMFNRRDWWLNDGSATTDYLGRHWRRLSAYGTGR